jgi:transcriptional regulator with XRE-family HTH domain
MTGEQHGEQELPPLDTLAARLDYLFDTIRPTREELGESDEPGRRYTNKEIADKINAEAAATGVTISAAYIGELRRGVAGDPRTSHVRALARAFGVSSGYFVDDAAARRIRGQISLLSDLRRMDVKQVALRQVLADTGLSATDTQLVEQMVDRLRRVAAADSGASDGAGTGGGPDECV